MPPDYAPDYESQTRLQIEHLNNGSLADTCSWLTEALHGRRPLPLMSGDEFPYLGVLRIEAALDKPTRKDLRTACQQLVHAFIKSGEGDADYLNSLLHLAVGLDLNELAAPLAALAREFPQGKDLPVAQKKLVLGTLIDLKVPQPAAFWLGILGQDPANFAGRALSGLLAGDRAVAVQTLAVLPDTQPIADAAAILLNLTWQKLTAMQRAPFIEQIQEVWPHCRPFLRAAVKEWLAEIGEPVVVKKSRSYDLLDKVLKAINTNFSPEPIPARLCGI